MKKLMKLLLIMTLLMSCDTVLGQLSQGGLPYSFSENLYKLSKNIPVIEMPLIKKTTIDQIKINNESIDKPYQFAHSFDVNINVKNSSVVDSLDIGLLYRLSINSTDAFSINLIFKKYLLPKGAKLFIYSSDKEHVIGAFTSNNNKKSLRLSTLPVKSNKIIVEYFEPYNSIGEVIIGKINHDFINVLNLNKIADDFGSSGDCNVDINCPEGDDWQTEKRAVCRIVKDGTSWCTGTLLNNTNYDGKPYFLTANHCISSQSSADDCIFIFNYESSSCDGSDGSTSQSISGATLRATRHQSDFVLLELSHKPLSSWYPYYAGWDSQNQIKNNVVGIHHPKGDVKKICKENDNIQSTENNSSTIDNTANHWRVPDWDTGVTEGGSSGSALFDDNHNVIGQLHGGLAACSGSTDNNQADYYGKFSTSWDEGGSSNNQLRDWLDPNNNIVVLNGVDVCPVGITLNLNITHTITSGSIELQQVTNNIEASNIVEYGATATYEAGNQIILKPGFHAESGSDFTAKIVPLNCVEGCYPISLTTWTNNVCVGDDLCFNTTYANNYTISITDIGQSLIYENSGIITDNSLCAWNTTDVVSGIYIVTISFSSECEEISNSYQLLVESCGKSAQEINTETLINDNKKNNTLFEKSSPNFGVNIFPNPNKGIFTISLINPSSKPYSFEISNSLGVLFYKMEHISDMKLNINQVGLPTGVYYIKFIRGTEITIKKIIIN